MSISLGSIVASICSRVGLTPDRIDVSDLNDTFVRGYVISRIMSARDAIEPLRTVGFFDIVESGPVLKFVKRGKAPVRTLTTDDFGARLSGEEPGPAITTREVQDVDLPRQIRLRYRAYSRDYEAGQQLSPSRLITDAINDVDIEVPITLDDDQAAQVAEVVWADAWASRWSHQTALDAAHADLEPADILLVPIDGRSERVRIQQVTDIQALIRKLEMVRDDDGTYVSTAIAQAPQIPGSGIVVRQPSELIFLDLPALRIEDDNAGFYVVARPTGTGNTWTGASVYRSVDGGAAFEVLAGVTNQAMTGTLLDALAPSDPDTTGFDEVSTVHFTHIGGAAPASASDAELDDGANALAVGADGRWEILQFGVATQLGPDEWELSHLLRHRRGTTYAMGTSLDGDTVVLISGPGLIRLPLTNDRIGESLLYRAVTVGASYATGVNEAFTGSGEALEPLPPRSIEGDRDTAGDLTITWVRQNRLGSELPGGSDAGINESTESYEIDVLADETTGAVVRTITVSIEEALYTAAQQTTDFGSPQASIGVRIYQLSSVVGRGHPGEAVI